MDSMLGYKNDKYLYFGRVAAKLDDVANYIPARISGWLMVAGTVFAGMDTKNAAKIYRRDRRNHASPNSAQTEAAMAGAGCTACGEMRIILENYMKNQRLVTRSVR